MNIFISPFRDIYPDCCYTAAVEKCIKCLPKSMEPPLKIEVKKEKRHSNFRMSFSYTYFLLVEDSLLSPNYKINFFSSTNPTIIWEHLIKQVNISLCIFCRKISIIKCFNFFINFYTGLNFFV